MSRTSQSIRMLTILLQQDRVHSTIELAKRLDDNRRNVREYKKELIEAGYDIRYVRGRNGGYFIPKKPKLKLEAFAIPFDIKSLSVDLFENLQAINHALQNIEALSETNFEKFTELTSEIEKLIEVDVFNIDSYHFKEFIENLELQMSKYE